MARMLAPAVVVAAVRKGLRWAGSAEGPPRAAKARAQEAHLRRKRKSHGSAPDRDSERAASRAAASGQPVPSQTNGSSGVMSPLDLGKSGWKSTLKRVAVEIKRDRITLTAAGLAFYWFLSVFPSLVAAIAALNLLHADPKIISGIQRVVGIALPEEAARVLTVAIANLGDEPRRASVLTSLIGLALALWSASSGMAAMQVGLDIAYDVGRERSFVRKRLYALVLVAGSMLFGGFSVGLIIFGQPLGSWMGENLPLGPAVVRLWTAARWAIALLTLTLLMALFYYLGPNRESPNWRWITPGGVLAMAVWVAASLGFSAYVKTFGQYGETYGSLAGVVILILWLYLAGLAMLLGAELNAELERQSSIQAATASAPA